MNDEETNTPVIRVDQRTNLDPKRKARVQEVDTNGDGVIDRVLLPSSISLQSNLLCRRIVCALLIGCVLLIGYVCGVSIVAATLSKETSVGTNGSRTDKKTGVVAKTTDAYETSTATKIPDMSFSQLARGLAVDLLPFLYYRGCDESAGKKCLTDMELHVRDMNWNVGVTLKDACKSVQTYVSCIESSSCCDLEEGGMKMKDLMKTTVKTHNDWGCADINKLENRCT